MNQNRLKINKNSAQGFMLLLSAIIVTSAVITIGVSIGLSDISIKKNVINKALGSKNFSTAQACLEEAVYRFTNDLSYTGGSFIANGQACTISINSTGPLTYEIRAVAKNDQFTRKLEANVQYVVDNFEVLDWQEIK